MLPLDASTSKDGPDIGTTWSTDFPTPAPTSTGVPNTTGHTENSVSALDVPTASITPSTTQGGGAHTEKSADALEVPTISLT